MNQPTPSARKLLLGLAIPIFIGGAVQTSYHLINAFWVGRLGANAVAVVSVCFPISLLLVSLASGLALAATILISQFFGANSFNKINHTVAQSITSMMLIALLLGALGYIAAPTILHLIGTSDAIFTNSLLYLRITLCGTVFMFLSSLYQSVLRGLGQAKAPLPIILSSVAINALLDPLFIFGWGPIDAMGVTGAAYATVLTQLITAVAGIGLMLRPRFGLTIHLHDLRPRWASIGQLMRIGFPASFEQSMQALTVSAMTALAASSGTVALAAYGMVFRMLALIMMPVFSLSMATSILAGQNIGAGNIDRARATTFQAAKTGTLLMITIGTLLFIFSDNIMRVFVPTDAALLAQSAHFLRLFTFSLPLVGIVMALNGTFRGAGDTLTVMLLTIIGAWGIQLPTAYILSRETSLGADGLWWSGVIANVIGTGVAYAYYRSNRWLKAKK